jgi:hypothetical protein
LEHISLILSQIVMKLWSFYQPIVVNCWLKYQSQKFCLSWERRKIPSICHARFFFRKLSREIVMYLSTPYVRLRQIIYMPLSTIVKGLSKHIWTDSSLSWTNC